MSYQFKQLSDKISPSMCSADENNVITSFYDYRHLILPLGISDTVQTVPIQQQVHEEKVLAIIS